MGICCPKCLNAKCSKTKQADQGRGRDDAPNSTVKEDARFDDVCKTKQCPPRTVVLPE